MNETKRFEKFPYCINFNGIFVARYLYMKNDSERRTINLRGLSFIVIQGFSVFTP